MHRICPYSGEKFTPRRRNQVFANAKNRRDFHNDRAAEFRQIKAPINKNLEKNLLLLLKLVPKGEIKSFSKQQLIVNGFNPSYFTHLKSHNGKICRCIYQFILPTSEDPNSVIVIYPETND
jgi:hypothetical protein